MNIAILGLPLLLLLIAAIVGAGYLIVRRPKVGALLFGVGVTVVALAVLGLRVHQAAVVETRYDLLEEQARAHVAQAEANQWRAITDKSGLVSRYACRELACRALARQVAEQIQTQGLAPAEGSPPLELAVELSEPVLESARRDIDDVLRSAIAERWPVAAKPVRIRWVTGDAPATTQDGNHALLRWSERNTDGKRVVAALEAGTTRAVLTAPHADKSWVVGELLPSLDSSIVVVGRSGLMPWEREAREAAAADAQRRAREQRLALAGGGRAAVGINDVDVIDECVQEVADSDGTKYMAAALATAKTNGAVSGMAGSSSSALPRSPVRSDVVRTVLAVAALLVMVVLAYLFLDAGTKGYYTWPLRIGAAMAFAVLCVIVMKTFGR